jgi:hypothetical protein
MSPAHRPASAYRSGNVQKILYFSYIKVSITEVSIKTLSDANTRLRVDILQQLEADENSVTAMRASVGDLGLARTDCWLILT